MVVAEPDGFRSYLVCRRMHHAALRLTIRLRTSSRTKHTPLYRDNSTGSKPRTKNESVADPGFSSRGQQPSRWGH